MPSEMRTTVGTREQRVSSVGAVVLHQRSATAPATTIEGHGALFNTETVIGGYFREVIAPGAFHDSISTDDIRVAFNHDANFILGRTSAKTATVEEDKKGLKYTAVPPDTQAGRDTVTSIKRGDITGSSFQFTVENEDDETWDFEQTKKGMLPLRTIKRAKLWEVGPVAFPAYETTTVSARAQAKVEEARALAEAAEAAQVPATETPAAPVTATRTAADIRSDILRDVGLLLDLATGQATSAQEPAMRSVAAAEASAAPSAPETAAAAAPAARAAEPDGETFGLDAFERELAAMEAECI